MKTDKRYLLSFRKLNEQCQCKTKTEINISLSSYEQLFGFKQKLFLGQFSHTANLKYKQPAPLCNPKSAPENITPI